MTDERATAAWSLAVDAEPGQMDRGELGERLTAVRLVRSRLDAVEVRAVRRLRSLAASGRSECAEAAIASSTDRSARDALDVAARDTLCDAQPGLENALCEGSLSAAHLDAINAAGRRLPDDVLAEYRAHGDTLTDRAARVSLDTFRRECHALAKKLWVQSRSASDVDELTAIPAETARRACCDAEIIPVVLGGDSRVLDLGRSRRSASREQRRALRSVHRGCAHPQCHVGFDSCRLHHVRHWLEHRGPTDLHNLLPLCERHHHLVHEGRWSVDLDHDRVATWRRPGTGTHVASWPVMNDDDPAHTPAVPSVVDRPIVIAANRLPVMRTEDGGWTPSPGGLVRALYPMLRESGGTWVGWTGDPDDAAEPFSVDGVELHPVGISAEEIELYYEGFSNDALWPLYHDALRESTYDNEQWEAYQAVNERFAVTLANIAPADSVVWIHDYQLQLVPGMLRQQRPDLTIGFFLHIPFPPVELFTRLPWRTELVTGLLGCDLVGFQRPTGATNFVAAANQLLGADHDDNLISYDGRSIRAGVFPISIDVAEVEEIASGRATRQRVSRIRARLGDPEVVMLGVDRLDYTKGIGLRLKAFAQLLEDGRLDPARHVMVQVATPTREAVEHYKDERAEIERLVGEINGRFSSIGLPVVHYLYQTLPYDDLVALYRAGDVMLVTPFRDGMNLVAKEYAAAHIDGDGVLVLSEFAGAADELTDAVLVNPHDDRALQDAIVEAVEMHRHERRARMAGLRDQIQKSDVQGWADRFLAAVMVAGDTATGDPTAGNTATGDTDGGARDPIDRDLIDREPVAGVPITSATRDTEARSGGAPE